MKQFTDKKGRVWNLEINVFQFKRCRDILDFDLSALRNILVPTSTGPKVLASLIDEPITFVNVLYVLCMDQAKADGVSDEEFGQSFDGETLERATNAFLEELALFLPEPVRSALTKIKEKAVEAVAAARAELSEEKISELLNSAIATPVSSESTPKE